MADIMRRPRRINNDGKSNTEVGIAKVALLPGSFSKIGADGQFIQALAASVAPIYIVNVADNIGLTFLDAVPITESATCDYAEQGRQFAALVAPGTVLVKDSPLVLHATNGTLIAATGGAAPFAYSQEIYTVPATPATGSLVRIRIA
jgi:hypothetical protein